MLISHYDVPSILTLFEYQPEHRKFLLLDLKEVVDSTMAKHKVIIKN